MQNKNGFLKVAAALMIVAQMVSAATDITAKFTCPNFKAEVYKLIGKTSPTAILDSDVSGITYFDVSNKNITSIAGIEYFTGLTSLDCYLNQLTELDVSKNTKLQILNCNRNQLTKIDLLKNTNLWWMDCSNNQLTSLDLSMNTELLHFWCLDNQLTELDVSKNTKLQILNCNRNQLMTLDVSNNTDLFALECYINELTTLDVSKNTELTHFDCQINKLLVIDISKNIKLLHFDCSHNKLTTLDVQNNINLINLCCRDNQLTELNLSNNTVLESLRCDKNQLTILDLSKTNLCGFVEISRNLFDSEDDIKGLNKGNYGIYEYSPQRRKNTITFDSQGGSAVAPLIDILSFEKITEPAAPTKEYHSFRGWFTDEACTKQWNFESNTVEQDITLYADWYDTRLGDYD